MRSAKAPNPATMSTRCCHDINPDMQSFTSIPAPRAAAAAAVDFAFILARSVLSQVSTGALLSICHDRSSSYQNKQGSRIYRTPTPLRYCPWWVSLSTCGGVKYMLSLLNHSEYTSFRVAYSWPLCANMTLSVKLELRNILQRRYIEEKPSMTVSNAGPDLGGGANWAVAQGPPQLRGLHKNSKKLLPKNTF